MWSKSVSLSTRTQPVVFGIKELGKALLVTLFSGLLVFFLVLSAEIALPEGTSSWVVNNVNPFFSWLPRIAGVEQQLTPGNQASTLTDNEQALAPDIAHSQKTVFKIDKWFCAWVVLAVIGSGLPLTCSWYIARFLSCC